MTGPEFHAYLVKLAMEAYDAANPNAAEYASERFNRAHFAAQIRERMAQAAQTFALEVEIADRRLPNMTDAEAEREQMRHEAERVTGPHMTWALFDDALALCVADGFDSWEAADDARASRPDWRHHTIGQVADAGPYVCPGCYAVGGEQHGPNCPDDDEPDDSLDGDHASALESVYGPDNDDRDEEF